MPAGVQSDGYRVAREFLTGSASAGWNGDSSALVYSGTPDFRRRANTMSTPQGAESSLIVEVQLQVVGSLDSHGVYTPIQQVAVTGRSLHHIVHSAHCHQTARHNAQTDEGDDGPAQESESGMAVLFSLLLRPAGLTDPPVLCLTASSVISTTPTSFISIALSSAFDTSSEVCTTTPSIPESLMPIWVSILSLIR